MANLNSVNKKNNLQVKIENIKDELFNIRKDINKRVIYDLKDSWESEEANAFTYKLEDVCMDIKKLTYKLDELKTLSSKLPNNNTEQPNNNKENSNDSKSNNKKES